MNERNGIKTPLPDARLRVAAEFVREGAVFADVGTDHAYLPLYLLSVGRIGRAVASDVAEGPLSRARRNAMAAGKSNRIDFLLTDGLSGMEDLGLTDIAVCGMGGEMIASILAAAPFIKDPGVRLILQPMSRPEVLRRYLYEAGFTLESERIAVAAGRIYRVLCAFFSAPGEVSRAELLLGRPSVIGEEEKKAYLAELSRLRLASLARLKGRKAGGRDTADEEAYLAALDAEKERIQHDGQ